MTPYAILGAVILAGGSYWQGRQDGAAGVISAQVRDEDVRRKTMEAAQLGAAQAIAKLEVKNVTIRQAIQREIVEKPVFRDCRSGHDAVRLLNSAAGHDEPASAPGGGQLPGPSEAPR